MSRTGETRGVTSLTLAGTEIDIWCEAADLLEHQLDDLSRTLSVDERARAERYAFRKDRDRFRARRGWLRSILARYVAVDPARLQFEYGVSGKPALGGLSVATKLRFNLSHSGGLVVCAVTRGREIGVDVEQIQPAVARERVAEHFFSAREVATLRALPTAAQPEGFFNCWTRKEAYVKARGEGLALGLDRFDVSLVPGDAAVLLRTLDDADEASRWSLYAWSPMCGYVAALALASFSFGPAGEGADRGRGADRLPAD